MTLNRLTRRITAWIAMFAILLAALAPSVSHALATRDGKTSSWMEICSATGTKLVKADKASSPAPAKKFACPEHCPFCSFHGNAADLPISSDFTLPVLSASSARPALFYHSSRPLFVWASAQSRAPPFHS
jgi:hypothetical protein